MALGDVLRFLMRVVHLGAMSAWLGGGLYFMLSRSAPRPVSTAESKASGANLRQLLRIAFALLLLSGTYLVFDRLAEPRVGVVYVGVLAVKLALVAAIVWVTGVGRSRGTANAARPPRIDTGRLVLGLGIGALALGVALALLYESAVKQP